MKPFTTYQQLNERFPGQLEKLISTILEFVNPDAIYLLGACIKRRRTESIFCEESPTGSYMSEYYLLVLLPGLQQKSIHEWQELLEQYCSKLFPVTIIVLETRIFRSWLDSAHIFASNVVDKAVPIYISPGTLFTHYSMVKKESTAGIEKYFNEGLNKVNEFLIGAELFILRNQHKMAVFMIHQAAEQSLRTLLKVSTGFHYNTHNLDRLIRYCNMVAYKLPDIFPRRDEKEKNLFKLLQRAYTEARYSSSYNIHITDVRILLERVKQVKDIFVTTSQSYLKSIPIT